MVASGEPYYANEVEQMLIQYGKEEIVYVTFVYQPLKDSAGKVEKVAIYILENTLQVERRKLVEVKNRRNR